MAEKIKVFVGSKVVQSHHIVVDYFGKLSEICSSGIINLPIRTGRSSDKFMLHLNLLNESAQTSELRMHLPHNMYSHSENDEASITLFLRAPASGDVLPKPECCVTPKDLVSMHLPLSCKTIRFRTASPVSFFSANASADSFEVDVDENETS
jgi:hypothetical protein